MNVKHLRAKYQIEQYPVTFYFPANVTQIISVVVSVLVGDVEASSLFAGIPAANDNTVVLAIAGGHPGAVYSIECTAMLVGDELSTVKGVLAVLPTFGVTPDNTSPAPLVEEVTTLLYPYETQESYGISADSKRYFLFAGGIDAWGPTPTVISLSVRSVMLAYEGPPDSWEMAVVPQALETRSIKLYYTGKPEDWTLSATARELAVPKVRIEYKNNYDEWTITVAPLQLTC